jgi:hypothetical protein
MIFAYMWHNIIIGVSHSGTVQQGEGDTLCEDVSGVESMRGSGCVPHFCFYMRMGLREYNPSSRFFVSRRGCGKGMWCGILWYDRAFKSEQNCGDA